MTRTTYQTHAKIERKIINLNNGGGKFVCLFADCERLAIEIYSIPRAEHRHPRHWPCDYADHVLARMGEMAHIDYPFCSERHREMHYESSGWRAHRLIASRGGAYGYLPTGSRGSRL